MWVGEEEKMVVNERELRGNTFYLRRKRESILIRVGDIIKIYYLKKIGSIISNLVWIFFTK